MDTMYEIPDFTKDASELEARNPNIRVDKPSDRVKVICW